MIVVQTAILNSSLKIQIPYGRIHIFFIHLPFKKNEDVNPIKDSHGGMNLEHLVLANKSYPPFSQKALLNPRPYRGHVKPFISTNMLSKSKENSNWYLITKISTIFLHMTNSRCQTKVLSSSIFQMQKFFQNLISN